MERILAALVIVSQVVLPSSAVCPDRKSVDSLDLTQFAGRWYGVSGPERFTGTYKCGIQEFHPRGNGVVNWSVQYFNTTNNGWPILHGEMGQIQRSGQFQGFRVGFVGGVRWQVLGTDYHRWAVVWQCHDSNDLEYAFVLSREPTISPQLLSKVQELLPDSSTYSPIDQSGCAAHTVPVWLPLVHASG